jgi:hypothetical protein
MCRFEGIPGNEGLERLEKAGEAGFDSLSGLR